MSGLRLSIYDLLLGYPTDICDITVYPGQVPFDRPARNFDKIICSMYKYTILDIYLIDIKRKIIVLSIENYEYLISRGIIE